MTWKQIVALAAGLTTVLVLLTTAMDAWPKIAYFSQQTVNENFVTKETLATSEAATKQRLLALQEEMGVLKHTVVVLQKQTTCNSLEAQLDQIERAQQQKPELKDDRVYKRQQRVKQDRFQKWECLAHLNGPPEMPEE